VYVREWHCGSELGSTARERSTALGLLLDGTWLQPAHRLVFDLRSASFAVPTAHMTRKT
jgi:hypothetical protein